MSLDKPPSTTLLDGLDGVIHLAANTQGTAGTAEAELSFAKGLAAQATARGIPLLFVSSQAAARDAPSEYGRTKFLIEQAIGSLGAVSVRPGLVVGGPAHGLFGLLLGLCRRSPVLPDFLPRPSVQPIHVDDLAEFLLRAISDSASSGRVLMAAGEPALFVDFLRALSLQRAGMSRVAWVVPVALARAALMVLSLFFGQRFAPSRLDSLLILPAMDARADLNAFGLRLRSLPSALTRSGTERRALLTEGYWLMRALVGKSPSSGTVRAYVRILATFGVTAPFGLPAKLLGSPILLASLDTPVFRASSKHGDLAWRMNIAYRLTETDPALAGSFLFLNQNAGLIRACLGLVHAALRLISCLVVVRFARRLFREASS